MNFGFWDACEGLPDTKGGNETAYINRALEVACKKHGAKKTLYSSIHMDAKEFAEEYNGKHYQVRSYILRVVQSCIPKTQ